MIRFFAPFKNRRIAPGQRVQVYRNLNKPGVTYSIRDAETGLVLGHANRVLLNKCYFVVKQAGRKRVLETKKKNVHAWIEGHWGIIHAGDNLLFTDGVKVKYNTYQNQTFVQEETGQHVLYTGLTYINEEGVYASGF